MAPSHYLNGMFLIAWQPHQDPPSRYFLYIIKQPTPGPTYASQIESFHVSSNNLNYAFAFAFGYFC